MQKYSGVPAGLDHAVKYAEDNDLYEKFGIMDLDAHERVPFTAFMDYLPDPWKHSVTLEELQRKEDQYLEGVVNQLKSEPANSWRLKNVKNDPYVKGRLREVKYHNYLLKRTHGKVTPEEAWWHRRVRGELRPDSDLDSVEDIAQVYFEKMKHMGIKRTTVLPGIILFGVAQDPRPELEVVCCQAYVDFMLDKFFGKYKEIIGVVPVPVRTPDKAVELIDSVAKEKGVEALYLIGSNDVQAGDPSYYPIYEVAQEKRLPIIFHGDVDLGGFFASFNSYLPINALSFTFGMIKQLSGLVLEGTVELFPHLKYAFLEGGITWLPWLMHRLDVQYMHSRKDAPLLRKLPSEYIADKCYVGTQPIEAIPYPSKLKWAFDFYRERDMMKNIVFCSDYPHPDWDVPSSVHGLGYITEKEKHMLLRDNALRFLERN